MARAGALDFNTLTPDMYVAVGLNPNNPRLLRQLGDVSQIPVTQEQRDKLGRIRTKRLRIVKILTIIILVTSVAAITVGAFTLIYAKNFPFLLGGSLIAGIMCLILAILSIFLVREGGKTPTGDETTKCFTHYVRGHYCCMFFVCQAVFSCLGLGGIWGTVSCLTRKPSDDFNEWRNNLCHPHTGSLLILSIFSLILTASLLIMTLVMCGSYCCQMRAFGVKSRYELLLDLQMARMAEMQQIQHQTMMSWGPQGQGYQPVPQGQGYPPGMQGQLQGQGYQSVPKGQCYPPGMQGQGYPPVFQGQGYPSGYQGQGQYHGQQPSAPPVSDYDKDSAPPPSYRDVMENV